MTQHFGDKQLTSRVAATTTDTTPTMIWDYPLSEGQVVLVEAKVSGIRSDGLAGGGYVRIGSFRREAAGDVTVVGAVASLLTAEDIGTWNCTLVANIGNQTVELQITGAATVNWEAAIETLVADV